MKATAANEFGEFVFFVANGDEDITHQSRIVKLTIRVGLLDGRAHV